MKKKEVFIVMLTLLLTSTVTCVIPVRPVQARKAIMSDDSSVAAEGQENELFSSQSSYAIDVYGGAENDGYGSFPDPFPAPYGGQGLDQPMDLVAPQSNVRIFANVTANGLPAQQVDVEFRIEGPYEKLPNGTLVLGQRYQIWYGETSTTGTNGVATLTCRMPWTCEDPDGITGIWKIKATARISNVDVVDTMLFYYERVVYIASVTTDKFTCGHLGNLVVTVDYQTHAIQQYPAFFIVALKDSSNVPFGLAQYAATIGGASFCTWKTGSFNASIFIPKWASYGYGSVHVNCYDQDPTNDGFAYGKEYSPCPEFFIGSVGDVNADKRVDMNDINAIAASFGSKVGMPLYSSKLEVNGDGKINMKDYYMACRHFGESYP